MSNLLLCRHHPTLIGDTLDYSLYENQYMTTEALESGNISFTIPAVITTTYITSISYRKNGGNWVTTNNSSSAITITVPVASGDVVEWKGIIPRSVTNGGGSPSYAKFVAGGAHFNLYGNLLSFFWGEEFIGKTEFPWQANNTNSYGARNLFQETNVVDASNFILPVLEIYFANDGNCHAYAQMFMGCTSLIYPPAVLPATIIGGYVYYQMFMGCTSMTTMPNMESIQDTTESARASYSSMFNGCTALQYNTQQTIHINRAVYQGCSQMFRDCTSIVNAPNIEVYEFGNPVSENGTNQAFDKMFYGCTSLETPPERFDITEVDNGTFYQTFANCSNLEYAPIINIRGLHFINSTMTPNPGRYTFADMFYHCTSLTDASGINIYYPEDSEWSGELSFKGMFEGCTAIVNGPSININGTVTLKSNKTFFQMCYNCQNMTTHDISIDIEYDPDVVISTGSNYGNHYMFAACKKIITSPRISQPVLIKEYEYNRIFDGCILLRNVYCNFDTIVTNGINCWLNAVYSTGTVHQAGSATLPTGSISGVPSGWTLNTNDWTSQRHARMRIYVTTPGKFAVSSLTQNLINTAYNDPESNCYSFDYYGDTLTFDDETYFVWENNDNSTYKLLTFTDNFYQLRLNSYEFGNGDDPYDWTYGIIDSPSTLYYDNDYLLDNGWFFIKCIRLQG